MGCSKGIILIRRLANVALTTPAAGLPLRDHQASSGAIVAMKRLALLPRVAMARGCICAICSARKR